MKYIIIVMLALSISSCRKIENNQWKHSSGYNFIGDWVELEENNIKNDTIIISKKPVAIIKSYKYRFVDYKLELVGIDNNLTGFYCSKGRK